MASEKKNTFLAEFKTFIARGNVMVRHMQKARLQTFVIISDKVKI